MKPRKTQDFKNTNSSGSSAARPRRFPLAREPRSYAFQSRQRDVSAFAAVPKALLPCRRARIDGGVRIFRRCETDSSASPVSVKPCIT